MDVDTVDRTWIGFDKQGLVDSTEHHAQRLADLVATSRGREEAPVPGLAWTVGDLTTHLATVAVWYAKYFSGTETFGYDVTDIARSNARFMAEYGAPAADVKAKDLRTSYAAMVEVTKQLDPLAPISWHTGPLPVAAVLGVGLNELLLHGEDLARALGEPWTIDLAAARHGIRAAFVTAPYVVNADLARSRPISYRVHLPGVTTSDWTFGAHGLEVGPRGTAARVSCSIRLDPATMLRIAYRRTTPLRSALSGKSLAWGRQPWAAFSFADYLICG